MDELEFLKSEGLVREDAPQNNEPQQQAAEPIVTDVKEAQPVEAQPEKVEATQSAPSIDYSTLLGDWASPEKAATIPEKLTRLEQLEAEYNKLKSSPLPSFANEEVAKFNSFVSKTGISDFGVFNKIKDFDPNTASAVEVLALQEVMENPELLKYGYDKVVQFVEKKYEDDLSDDELGSIAMDMKSSKAKKQLLEMKSSLEESLYQASAPNTAKVVEQWKPVADAVVKNLNSISIGNSKGNGFEFKVDDRHKQGLLDEALGILSSSNLELNEESIKSVQTFMESKIKLQYFDEIISSYESNVESKLRSEFQAKYENASDLTNRDVPDSRETNKESDADRIFRMELEQL
jgi:hypothetical protein